MSLSDCIFDLKSLRFYYACKSNSVKFGCFALLARRHRRSKTQIRPIIPTNKHMASSRRFSRRLPAGPGLSGVAARGTSMPKNATFLGRDGQWDRASKEARLFEAPWQWSAPPDVPAQRPLWSCCDTAGTAAFHFAGADPRGSASRIGFRNILSWKWTISNESG